MRASALVSVIVPVYQAENYLKDCLESLCRQSLQELELIIVNDGSTDGSLDIIQSFAAKDTRIRCLDLPNQGVSAARNAGLELATGEYVGFVDADDWVDDIMYQELYALAVDSNADLVIANVYVHDSDNTQALRLNLKDDTWDLDYNRDTFFEALMDFKFDYANWNKLFRRSWIAANGLKFSSELKIWEDLLFNLEFACMAKSVVTTNKAYYHYRMHEHSVMQQQKHLRSNQYNKLYNCFMAYCNDRKMSTIEKMFRSKMASGYYNVLIPDMALHANLASRSASSFVKNMTAQLQLVNPEIFHVFSRQGNLLQRFKKWLLRNKRYKFFSVILAFKHYHKK